MRDSGMSKVCLKRVSAPGAAWLDFPTHTLDKTTNTLLDILVLHVTPVLGLLTNEVEGLLTTLYLIGNVISKIQLQWQCIHLDI